jgi:BMFP domain-containing protein YqiC
MQTKNPFLDEMARLMTGAMGAAQSVGDEAQAMARSAAEKFIADMDLVRRDEFEVVKSLAQQALSDVEMLKARIVELEKDNT